MAAAIHQDEWVAELEKLQRERVPQIPSGWLTPSGYAEKTNISLSYAKEVMTKLVNAGKAERKRFQVLYDSGVRSVYHYRLKK